MDVNAVENGNATDTSLEDSSDGQKTIKLVCTVCATEIATGQEMNRRFSNCSPTCKHEFNIHQQCFLQLVIEHVNKRVRYRNVWIEEDIWDTFECVLCRPGSSIPEAELRNSLPQDLAEAIDRAIEIQIEQQDPAFRYCLSTSCGIGGIYDAPQGDDKMIACAWCGHKMCFFHQRPWHDGMECGQYDAENGHHILEDFASCALIDAMARVCPGCGLEWTLDDGKDGKNLECPCYEQVFNFYDLMSLAEMTEANEMEDIA